ncbi:MAG: hypothetical protein NT157_03310, partial [Candidatus Micrarchaeota archaeon]|nr:hypothetical protein [Candidatus Micrarchaeota archaeon]
KLYENNKTFAILMESVVDSLYGTGKNKSYYPDPTLASLQSRIGKEAVRSTLKDVALANLEQKTITNWVDRVYGMADPIHLGHDASKVDEIRSGLKLEGKTNDNIYVGFGVDKQGKLYMNVFDHIEITDTDERYNPILLYQVRGGGGADPVFNNNFSSLTFPLSGKIKKADRKLKLGLHQGLRIDYDNRNVAGEQEIENYVTKLYGMNAKGDIYIFASSVIVDEKALLQTFNTKMPK